MSADDTLSAGQFTVNDYEGTVGDRTHITRNERGMIPTAAIAHLHGAAGEVPGEHRNLQGEKWESYKARMSQPGNMPHLFVTVDHGRDPVLSEGNHRRDVAVETGMSHVPVEIMYYGHAERQGSVLERHQRQLEQEAGR